MSQIQEEKESVPEKWFKGFDGFEINNNVITYKKYSDEGGGLAYGTTEVSSGIHEWVIKYVEKSTSYPYSQIGITSNCDKMDAGFIEETKYSVQYSLNSRERHIKTWLNESESSMEYCVNLPETKSGDSIRLLLNLDEQTLSYFKPPSNNSPFAVVKDLPKNEKWRLTVYGQYPVEYTIVSSKKDLGVYLMDFDVNQVNTLSNGLYTDKTLDNIKKLDKNDLLKLQNEIKTNKKNFDKFKKSIENYSVELEKVEKFVNNQIEKSSKE